MSEPTTYVHGCDTAYVGPGCVLLLPAGAAGTADDLWPLVRDGAEIDAVLEAHAVRGMRDMGPFALLTGRRVLLRGSGRALLDTGQELTGAPFMTWAEHGVDDGQQIRLRVGDATDPADGPESPHSRRRPAGGASCAASRMRSSTRSELRRDRDGGAGAHRP